ncbi:hypothetical protein FPQ18DRAFT_327825 [Pyronema domesticum]|nr:hypothetical protein FPQ18DRAFT_327825 [Pyronema domesticum]
MSSNLSFFDGAGVVGTGVFGLVSLFIDSLVGICLSGDFLSTELFDVTPDLGAILATGAVVIAAARTRVFFATC